MIDAFERLAVAARRAGARTVQAAPQRAPLAARTGG
jgi:hypothetical protein